MRSFKTTKWVAILAGLFFLMGFYAAEATAKEKYEEKFEKTVSLAKDGKVTLKNITGSIDVKSWNKGEVKIDATKISSASTLEKAKENAGLVKIEVEKEGNTLQIKTEYPDGGKIFRRRSMNVSVKYSLVIPAKASIKVSSVTGSVDLEKIGGAVKVDIVTGGYALRNAPDFDQTLCEIFRVLKPGGKAFFLDFSKSHRGGLQKLGYVILKIWGSTWGILFHKNPDIYGYIAESLRTYPDRRTLKKKVLSHGFTDFNSSTFFLGLIEMFDFKKQTNPCEETLR